ncbi:hypothetical protein [Methanobrevibacter sp.]|uniref:hypothetical protein n=1 Tax=Methanobrevibacter sp. TaxID=66852 RepID=UPI00388DC1A4
MSGGITKAQEIKRLTTPLVFKDSKAYDCEGNMISCVETLSDVKFIIEPREGILSDDEIMQYAPESKKASEIKLRRGYGTVQDALLVHESLPWMMGLYYLILLSIAFMVVYAKNTLLTFIILILFIIPLLYAYRAMNLKGYRRKAKKVQKSKPVQETKNKEVEKQEVQIEDASLDSLKEYDVEINNLKVLFDVKEGVVRDLIDKKFEPPQITHDKFTSMIDSCHKLFYNQVDSAQNITKLAVEDTPRIRDELDGKVRNMKTIINQIEDLTNELVINISSDSQSENDVKILLDDMENLIDSVKDYKE